MLIALVAVQFFVPALGWAITTRLQHGWLDRVVISPGVAWALTDSPDG